MKVIYTDPDGRAGTFHPRLGWLESGKAFEMKNDNEANKYIESGLLKKVFDIPVRAVTQGKNKIEPKEEVKENGKSINR